MRQHCSPNFANNYFVLLPYVVCSRLHKSPLVEEGIIFKSVVFKALLAEIKNPIHFLSFTEINSKY